MLHEQFVLITTFANINHYQKNKVMLGTELKEYGQLINNKELMLVHIKLEKGKKIPAHDHCGQDVFFTLIKGNVEVTLAEQEKHNLMPGTVLRFAGENKIGVEALEDSEFFVYLINIQK